MAVQTLKMRIQLRRATTAEWTANKDVVPAAGEPCFDVELNTLKIGDGAKTYEQLEPIGGAGTVEVSADGTSIVLDDGVFKLAGFDAAETGAQPRKKADGTLEWVVPSTETVEGLQTTVAGLQSDVTNLQTDVSAVKEILTPSGEGSSTLLERVEGLEGKVGGESINDQITAAINKFATDVSDDGVVNSYKELIDYVAKHGDEAANMAADITVLQGLVGNKSVSDQINEAVSGKVDAVPGKGLSTNDFTDTLLEKLENIESGAQVNKIEKIDIGGSTADIVDKTINIPIASLDKAGVIRSSTGANKVNVSSNGEMSVNKISVDSIFVPIGSELILDGGGASTNPPVYPTRIGNIGYDSIVDAINGADNGDVITLQDDVNMGANDDDHLIINAENVTIDLGEKTFTANGSLGAVKVESGVTTLDGTGTVSGTLGSDNYSMAIWTTGGTTIINGGTYKNETDNTERGTDLIYASATGCIEINGGTFEAAKPEWTLNCRDADYKAGTAKIIVKGGRFKNFDPANNNAEGANTNFVAEGYESIKEGDYYVVKRI
nr:MAG TPA: hyaluronidase [Caudoviricetes sp.]